LRDHAQHPQPAPGVARGIPVAPLLIAGRFGAGRSKADMPPHTTDHEESWVTRFAANERHRNETEDHMAVLLAHSADVALFRLQTLLGSLRECVAEDVAAFALQFPERSVHFENVPVNGGFAVRREHYPEARVTVIPDMSAGTLHIEYLFASMQGITTPKPLELTFDGDDVRGWHFKDDPDHRVRSVYELSEYLLVPVFSGYPRYLAEKTP
jgi:hypothetical protein